MKTATGVLLVCAAAATSGLLGNASADTKPRLQHFIVHYTTGPSWVAGAPFTNQPYAGHHSANLSRMRSDGAILFGARYSEKGMIIVNAESEGEARMLVERDSAVVTGTFVYEIESLHPFYYGCIESQS